MIKKLKRTIFPELTVPACPLLILHSTLLWPILPVIEVTYCLLTLGTDEERTIWDLIRAGACSR
jgi:hypothetical protein